jgi:hypothetical protein
MREERPSLAVVVGGGRLAANEGSTSNLGVSPSSDFISCTDNGIAVGKSSASPLSEFSVDATPLSAWDQTFLICAEFGATTREGESITGKPKGDLAHVVVVPCVGGGVSTVDAVSSEG